MFVPLHAQLVAAGEQLAFRGSGVLSVPLVEPCTLHVGGDVTTQVSTCGVGGIVAALSVKELQFKSVSVIDCAIAAAEVRARTTAVLASEAQRTNDRFMCDSSAKPEFGRLYGHRKFRASPFNENS